jgi:hypothetical protein
VLKGLEDLHIWILWNFVGEFMGGALWMAGGISFQKFPVFAKSCLRETGSGF